MNTPLILLCGQAGSGKDTVANMLVQNHGAIAIAQADPMKRFVLKTFGFSEDQLWGPSELRNETDTSLGNIERIYSVTNLVNKNSWNFVTDLFGEIPYRDSYCNKLLRWADSVLEEARIKDGISPRYVLQTLGTEWGRDIDREMWTRYAKNTALRLLSGGYEYNKSVGLIINPSSMPNVVVITDGRFRNEIISVTSVGGEAWKVQDDRRNVQSPGIQGHASENEQKLIPNYFYKAIIHNDRSQSLDKLSYMVDWIYNDRVVHDVSKSYNYALERNGTVKSFSYLWDKMGVDL